MPQSISLFVRHRRRHGGSPSHISETTGSGPSINGANVSPFKIPDLPTIDPEFCTCLGLSRRSPFTDKPLLAGDKARTKSVLKEEKTLVSFQFCCPQKHSFNLG
ncbi:hypothetical protein R6Q59_004296 [Mikania micrantha]